MIMIVAINAIVLIILVVIIIVINSGGNNNSNINIYDNYYGSNSVVALATAPICKVLRVERKGK